jgi:hypothetical protein
MFHLLQNGVISTFFLVLLVLTSPSASVSANEAPTNKKNRDWFDYLNTFVVTGSTAFSAYFASQIWKIERKNQKPNVIVANHYSEYRKDTQKIRSEFLFCNLSEIPAILLDFEISIKPQSGDSFTKIDSTSIVDEKTQFIKVPYSLRKEGQILGKNNPVGLILESNISSFKLQESNNAELRLKVKLQGSCEYVIEEFSIDEFRENSFSQRV